MSENILLISDQIIKERTAIHGNIDPKLLYPEIKVAQDMYIEPILGTALYVKLQTLVSDGSIADVGNSNYKLLLDKYLIDVLMQYTLSALPVALSYQFWNKGVLRKQGQDTTQPDMGELIHLANKAKNIAEWYATRMRLFIIANAPKMFPEYLSPGSTIDTITPEQRNFTMPIYLGEEGRDNPWCNEGGFNGQPYNG